MLLDWLHSKLVCLSEFHKVHANNGIFLICKWLVEEIEQNLLRARRRFRDLQQQAGACGLSNGDVVSTKESWYRLTAKTNGLIEGIFYAFWLLCTYRFAPLKANLNIEESVRCATDWLCWTEFAEFETFCNQHFGHSGLEVRRYRYNCSIFLRIARRCIYKAVMRTCECQVLDPGLAVLTGGPLSKGMDLSPGRIVATLQHFCLYT